MQGEKLWLAVHCLPGYVLDIYEKMDHITKQVWSLSSAFYFSGSSQEDEHCWFNCLLGHSRPQLSASLFLWVNDEAVISLKLLDSENLLIWSLGTRVVNTLFGIFSSFRFKNSWRYWSLRFFFWIKFYNSGKISQKPQIFPSWSLGDNAIGLICACD